MKKRNRNNITTSLGVKRIYDSCKANPLGAFVITLSMMLFTGIVNSMFVDFYDSCSKAMRNASVGFWQKLVDLYYIYSARVDTTDVLLEMIFLHYGFFVIVIWTLLIVLNNKIREMRCLYQEIVDNCREVGFTKSAEMERIECKGCYNEGRTKRRQLRIECGRRIKLSVRYRLIIVIMTTLMTLIIAFKFSLTMFANGRFKMFNLNILATRPFMTDMEYYRLKQQWVLMTSKADYEKILKTLQKYSKRSAKQCEEDEVECKTVKRSVAE